MVVHTVLKSATNYSSPATSFALTRVDASLAANISAHCTFHICMAITMKQSSSLISKHAVPALNHLIKSPVCGELVAGAGGECDKSSTNLIKVGIMRGLGTGSHARPFHCILQLHTNATRYRARTHARARAQWSILHCCN